MDGGDGRLSVDDVYAQKYDYDPTPENREALNRASSAHNAGASPRQTSRAAKSQREYEKVKAELAAQKKKEAAEIAAAAEREQLERLSLITAVGALALGTAALVATGPALAVFAVGAIAYTAMNTAIAYRQKELGYIDDKTWKVTLGLNIASVGCGAGGLVGGVARLGSAGQAAAVTANVHSRVFSVPGVGLAMADSLQ